MKQNGALSKILFLLVLTSVILEMETGPTLAKGLEVSSNSSLPNAQASEAITATNASQVKLLKQLGDDWRMAVAYSPDGETLAVQSFTGLWLYFTQALERPKYLVDHEVGFEDTAALAFSPDGTLLAVGGGEDGQQLWNVRTGQLITSFRDNMSHVSNIAFSPDGTLLAYGGNWLAAKDQWYPVVQVWNLKTGYLKAAYQWKGIGSIFSVAFSPDGTLLAAGGEALATCCYAGSDESQMQVWNLKTDQRSIIRTGRAGDMLKVAFSPDGKLLAGTDGGVTLWTLKTSSLLASLPMDDNVVSVAFSPDGTVLATANDNGTVGLWNVKTQQLIIALENDSGPIDSVAFNRDGTALFSHSEDGTTNLWGRRKEID